MRNPLYKNIYEFYSNIHPSIRVNRIMRDLPGKVLIGGIMRLGMRAEIEQDIETMNGFSNCIRYREAGNYRNKKESLIKNPVLKVLKFDSSEGVEYFLSFETDEEKPILYSFLILRLSINSGKNNYGDVVFPELLETALIRELHTYGKVTPCKENIHLYDGQNKIFFSQGQQVQHMGYGKMLINKAEEIAINNNFEKIAVIAGVGVRNYYRKLGYNHDTIKGCYQVKFLKKNIDKKLFINYKLTIII